MNYLYSITALNLKSQAFTRLGMSPNEAANLDREAFLMFAAEVEKVARKLRKPKVEQLSLTELVSNA